MLSGNLELFALADVLRFVARSGATGAVNIYRSSDGGRVLLADGKVVGAVVEETVAPDADGVVDAVMRLMDAGGGDFALELEPATGPTKQPVEEFLKAVGRRRAEWSKILGSLGSLDGPLDVTALVPSGTAEITLTPLEWHLAVLADGRRSLRDIAADAGASEFAAATALLAMSNAGLLALPGGPVAHVESFDEDEEDHDDQDDQDEQGDAFAYDDEAEDVAADAGDPDTSDEDVDPAELLRELGEQRAVKPRSRRLTPATREEQRIHLRSR
jgi:hypothetical protein